MPHVPALRGTAGKPGNDAVKSLTPVPAPVASASTLMVTVCPKWIPCPGGQVGPGRNVEGWTRSHSHVDVRAVAHRSLLWGSGTGPALDVPAQAGPLLSEPSEWPNSVQQAHSPGQAGRQARSGPAVQNTLPPALGTLMACPQGEYLGDPVRRSSVWGLRNRGVAPSPWLVDVPWSHTLPPATGPGQPCAPPQLGPAYSREALGGLLTGNRAGCATVRPRGRGAGSRAAGRTPAEEARCREPWRCLGNRGF